MIKFLIPFFIFLFGSQNQVNAQNDSDIDKSCSPKTVFELFKKNPDKGKIFTRNSTINIENTTINE